MTLAGIVLAAGRSARMGSPKALLDFRGLPFAVRILEALEALEVKTRVVVLGPDAPRILPAIAGHDCIIVENPEPETGPIASLRGALRALQPLQPGAALVWPVDLPHVRVTTVERVLEAHRRTGDRGARSTLLGRDFVLDCGRGPFFLWHHVSRDCGRGAYAGDFVCGHP